MVQARTEVDGMRTMDVTVGTGTTASGTLDVATGLGTVSHFSATWTEAPGADTRWYWSAVKGLVTITSTNESKTFSWIAYGRV